MCDCEVCKAFVPTDEPVKHRIVRLEQHNERLIYSNRKLTQFWLGTDCVRCRWCRKPIHKVNDDWRDAEWLTWCSQDRRHEPEPTTAVFTVAEYDAAVAARTDCNPGCACGGNPKPEIVEGPPIRHDDPVIAELLARGIWHGKQTWQSIDSEFPIRDTSEQIANGHEQFKQTLEQVGERLLSAKAIIELTPSGETPALVKEFAKTQRVKMRRQP